MLKTISVSRRVIQGTAVFILAMALSVTGCARKPRQKELALVTIAFQEWVGYGPFYLAKDKGFFEDEGIRLVVVDEQLDSARRDAFKRGMLDCEAGTIDQLVLKRAQEAPVVGVMEIDISYGGDGIVASENIKSVEDLAGKKVILARDDVGETFLAWVLREKGLSLDDVDIVAASPGGTAEAFLAGKGDAAVTWEPDLSRASERPGSHILITSRDKPGIIIDTLNVREDLVRDHPELVGKLMRAWFRALEYYGRDPAAASAVIAGYYGVTPDEYREQVKGLKWVGYGDQALLSDPKKLEEVFNGIAELKLAGRRISGLPDARGALESGPLKEIYEDRR